MSPGGKISSDQARHALALATGITYEAVTGSGITAHPAKKPYPKGDKAYVIPIAKGGLIEWVYAAKRTLEMRPLDMVSFATREGGALGDALLTYHKARIEAFGGTLDEAYQLGIPYRFYVMERAASILSPTHKKYVQVSALMDLGQMDLRWLSDPCADGPCGRQVRIIPMDSSAIHGQSCTEFFTQTVPGRGGKYYFGRNSVKSPAGSLLLFQMRSKLVASARLKRTVKGPVTNEWGERQGGYYVLDVDSISIPPEPVTLEEFIRIVPPFEGKRFSNAMHVVPSEYEGAIEEAFCREGRNQSADDGALDLTTVVEGVEGGRRLYYTTRYERDPKNRRLAISIHGARCQACGFDFEEAYGPLGRGFIEVHHRKPLHTLEEEMPVNPRTDLACVCSNCHRMLHREKGRMLSVEELQDLIEVRRTDAI